MKTDRTNPGEDGAARVRPMEQELAPFLRRLCTMLRIHRGCAFKVCRRANACATRNVVCYQTMEEEIQPIARSIIARGWRDRVEAGENPDVEPARRDGWLRQLAQEAVEIPRLLAGEYGGDDALTPYQLWLKYWASQDRQTAGKTRHLAGSEPYDPDARDRDRPWVPPKIVKIKDAPPPPSVMDTLPRD